jgi:hypothetical protein
LTWRNYVDIKRIVKEVAGGYAAARALKTGGEAAESRGGAMRFLMIVKANKDSEAGIMPDEGLLSAMMKYNEEMAKAGVLQDLAGLQPSARGARVKFSGGEPTVIEGPFPETSQLIAGYWLIDVKSREEAIAWAKRCPNPQGEGKPGEIEIRQLFELDDFGPGAATDRARELEKELAKLKKK